MYHLPIITMAPPFATSTLPLLGFTFARYPKGDIRTPSKIFTHSVWEWPSVSEGSRLLAKWDRHGSNGGLSTLKDPRRGGTKRCEK